jgi:hypothetical protein
VAPMVDCRIILLSGTRRVHMQWRSTLHGNKAATGPMRARDENRSNASQSATNPADVGIKTTFEQCIQSEQASRCASVKVHRKRLLLRSQYGPTSASAVGGASAATIHRCLSFAVIFR